MNFGHTPVPEKHKLESPELKLRSSSRLRSILKPFKSSTKPQRHRRPSSAASVHSWKHHSSYFPQYEPIVQQKLSIGDPYAFDNGPLQSEARAKAEAAAAEHSALVGHPVVVHYPALPKFDENAASKNWKKSTWGLDRWTGFGWAGEKLPDKDGLVFANAMPVGTIEGVGSASGNGGGGGGKAGGGGDKVGTGGNKAGGK